MFQGVDSGVCSFCGGMSHGMNGSIVAKNIHAEEKAIYFLLSFCERELANA